MELSSLQLEGYYVKELSFSVRPDMEAEATYTFAPGLQLQPASTVKSESIKINSSVVAAVSESEPNRFRVELTIESAVDPIIRYPYPFRVVMVGFFRYEGDPSLEESRQIISVNSSTLLYSSAREVLAAATGRGPFPGVQLPTVSFSAAYYEQLTSSEGLERKVNSKPATKPRKRLTKKSAVKSAKK